MSFLIAEFMQSLCGQFRQLPTSQSLASRSLARSLIRQSSAKAAVRTSLAYTLTDRNGRFSVWDSQNRLVSCLMGAVPKYSVRTALTPLAYFVCLVCRSFGSMSTRTRRRPPTF